MKNYDSRISKIESSLKVLKAEKYSYDFSDVTDEELKRISNMVKKINVGENKFDFSLLTKDETTDFNDIYSKIKKVKLINGGLK